MILSNTQILITIAMVAFGTVITRFLPFILFPANKETPSFIAYLGKVLPYAAIGLLVVYSLKDVSVTSASFGIPEAISIIIIALLHYWKNNALLSIGVGTLLYMFLVQVVFI